MYEQHVDVAVLAVGEGFARAYGNPFQIDARVLFEDGLEIFQKAGACVLVVVAIIKVSALAIWGSSRRERTRKALSRRIEKRSLQKVVPYGRHEFEHNRSEYAPPCI